MNPKCVQVQKSGAVGFAVMRILSLNLTKPGAPNALGKLLLGRVANPVSVDNSSL
jgi:hypothetical protein